MPESEPQFLGGLDDLWKQAFRALAELYLISEHNWNFSNLADAFKEGGVLHKEKVFLFGCTEPQLLSFDGQWKVTYIPVIVVIVSTFPPSDKIGLISVQVESEEIVDMENMNMNWVPYIPPGQLGSLVERLDPQIYILSCVQIEAASEHLELCPVENFQYCLPYFNNPFKVDETEQSTIVEIVYQMEARPIVYEFDWKFDEPEEFTNELIDADVLSRDHKDAFKEFVKEKVQEGKRANHEALRKRMQAQEELRTQQKDDAAFGKMRFYKFYPVVTPDTPDVSCFKSSFINRYYGSAHQVF